LIKFRRRCDIQPCHPTPSVYSIRHRATGRVYIGVTSNLRRRIAQHRKKPPQRMRKDLQAAASFDAAFEVTVLLSTTDQRAANEAEKQYIAEYKAQGPDGYNKFPGKPGSSKAFWYQLRRGLLQLRQHKQHPAKTD
jgi:predicted GIY-YIG superfamily endonuclease